MLRTAIASLTLSIGIVASLGVRSLNRPRQQQLPPCLTPTVEPPKVERVEEVTPEYPDDREASPGSIQYFIDENPNANLEKLWKRLGRSGKSDSVGGDFNLCYGCKADSFEFDLDGEPGDETVLKISAPLMESFRYLVFKWEVDRLDRPDKWKLIGLIDEWGKYKDSRHFVLLGSGTPLLVVQGQGANGSGVALYNERVFLVTSRGIRQIFAYPVEGHQSGWFTEPDREFTGRVTSFQIKSEQIEIALKFEVRYFDRDYDAAKEVLLFSKTQLAVYSGPLNGELRIQPHKSTISEREIEHIYNIDSMNEDDFLKYNLPELLNLAKGGNQHKRHWLKTFLDRLGDSIERDRLVASLDN